jgi:glutathione peroxidase
MSDDLYDAPVTTLGGVPADLHDFESQAVLVVNTASQCGLTPQYAGLQRLQDRYAGRGFTVLAFPCNQFGRQEPGSADDIRSFCRDRYGVGFPVFDKVEVNGPGRHPLYASLTRFWTPTGSPATFSGTSRSSSCRLAGRRSSGSGPKWNRSHRS